MKIIRHGNFDVPSKKIFNCMTCGCVFEVNSDADDMKAYSNGYSTCPECCSLSFEVSDEEVNESISSSEDEL